MSEKPTNSGYPLTDFRNLTSPIIDVRSPIEFSKGHWPGAINIPMFSDSERDLIGKSYKKESRLKAIFNGLAMTLPKTKKISNLMGTLKFFYMLMEHTSIVLIQLLVHLVSH